MPYVDAIFAEKVPKVKDEKRKKWLVGAFGGSDWSISQYLRFIMMMMLNNRKRMNRSSIQVIPLQEYQNPSNQLMAWIYQRCSICCIMLLDFILQQVKQKKW